MRLRTGIDMFADFYSLSTFYDNDNFFDKDMATTLLPHVRKELLEDSLLCIMSEQKYFYAWFFRTQFDDIFKRFGLDPHEVQEIRCDEKQGRWGLYDYLEEKGLKRRFVSACKVCFLFRHHWPGSYGGPAWAMICDRWLNLDKFDFGRRFQYLQQSFSMIDKVIDACHNTGNCFNKLYPEINAWLSVKTNTIDPYWIIDQCSFRRYACRRMKEQYGMTHQRFEESRRVG